MKRHLTGLTSIFAIVMAMAGAVTMALPASSAAQEADSAAGGQTHTVVASEIIDWKAVFATIESQNVTAARTRIGGIVSRLAVDEGDKVEANQLLATIVDEKLGLRQSGATAEVRALEAARANARVELDRARQLFADGFAAKSRLDAAQAAFDMADSQLNAARAQRSVASVQEKEGEVLAPATGVVLQVPVVEGAVVTPGEAIATIAQGNYVLRISLPERHASDLGEGDPVRIAGAAFAADDAKIADEGVIVRVYPEITNGRVFADAYVDGIGDYFVGQRVRVLVGTSARKAITVPVDFIETRFGVDFVKVRHDDGAVREVVVQRGRGEADAGIEAVEILSGVREGDVLVKP
ncbi:MAG: efflux RND transporter periplasmic adaptor subunit [Parvularculaceae bacterium]